MPFTFENSKLKIESVKGVLVTDIEEDTETGVYARLISVYVDDESVTNRRPVLEIYVTDTEKGSLEITTPNLTF